VPREHEPTREPQGVRVPPTVSRALLLLGAALMVFSLVRNDGRAGALTALGALTLGWGLGFSGRHFRR